MIYKGVEQEACVGSARLAPSGCRGRCLEVPLRSLSPAPGRPRKRHCASALFKTNQNEAPVTPREEPLGWD